MKKHIPSVVILIIIVALFFIQRSANKDLATRIDFVDQKVQFLGSALYRAGDIVSSDNGASFQINPQLMQTEQ